MRLKRFAPWSALLTTLLASCAGETGALLTIMSPLGTSSVPASYEVIWTSPDIASGGCDGKQVVYRTQIAQQEGSVGVSKLPADFATNGVTVWVKGSDATAVVLLYDAEGTPIAAGEQVMNIDDELRSYQLTPTPARVQILTSNGNTQYAYGNQELRLVSGALADLDGDGVAYDPSCTMGDCNDVAAGISNCTPTTPPPPDEGTVCSGAGVDLQYPCNTAASEVCVFGKAACETVDPRLCERVPAFREALGGPLCEPAATRVKCVWNGDSCPTAHLPQTAALDFASEPCTMMSFLPPNQRGVELLVRDLFGPLRLPSYVTYDAKNCGVRAVVGPGIDRVFFDLVWQTAGRQGKVQFEVKTSGNCVPDKLLECEFP